MKTFSSWNNRLKLSLNKLTKKNVQDKGFIKELQSTKQQIASN